MALARRDVTMANGANGFGCATIVVHVLWDFFFRAHKTRNQNTFSVPVREATHHRKWADWMCMNACTNNIYLFIGWRPVCVLCAVCVRVWIMVIRLSCWETWKTTDDRMNIIFEHTFHSSWSTFSWPTQKRKQNKQLTTVLAYVIIMLQGTSRAAWHDMGRISVTLFKRTLCSRARERVFFFFIIFVFTSHPTCCLLKQFKAGKKMCRKYGMRI